MKHKRQTLTTKDDEDSKEADGESSQSSSEHFFIKSLLASTIIYA